MSNDAYIDNTLPDDSDTWYAQLDQDQQYQAQFEGKQWRAKSIWTDALERNKNLEEAIGWMSMLVVELQDQIKHLERSK